MLLSLILLSGCEEEDDMTQLLPVPTLSGTYNSSGYVYNATTARAFTLTKQATASSTPYTINVDLGDFSAQGFKASLFIDPMSYKVYISPAPGANTPPGGYLLYSTLPSPFTPQVNFSALANNYFDPATSTIYLRVGWNPGTNGFTVVEEKLVKQ
jgi:hypothetical protein